MKILFLDAYYEPEQIAFTHLENDLLEGLVAAGHDIEIVCPTPTRGISPETARAYAHKKSEVSYAGHVHVMRFSAPGESRSPVTRALRYFWCNLRTYQIGRRVRGVDAVFANSTPPTQGRIAGMVARKHRAPFLFSLQDIFPDSLVNAGMTRAGSMLWKIGRRLEDRTYANARTIITICEGFRQNLLAKGVPASKIIVVPNWIDAGEVYDVSRADNVLFDQNGLDRDKFYVCYSGNIGHSQNLELLVKAARALQDLDRDIEFVIIGEGAAKDDLREAVKREGLTNVHLLPFQPYEYIAQVFSLGDMGLIISKPGIGGSSVPSKTWSIMAAGRPVLASFDSDSELNRLVGETGCGYTVEAGDSDGLVQAIRHCRANAEEARAMGARGRRYVCENLDKATNVGRYREAFEEMAGAKRTKEG